MKKTTKLKAFMLSLMMAAMMLPIASFAQNDNIIQDWGDENGVRDFSLTWAITNNSFGTSPLGSGLLILTSVGAGYAVAKRRRNRKNGTMMLLALAMIVGMTGCRKKVVEPIVNPSSGGTTYTINLNTGNGSKVNVTGADVDFTIEDKLIVAHNGKYVGTLNHNGTVFTGDITTTVADDPADRTPLYFYFLGNKDTGTLTAGTTTSCTVNISNQTDYPHLPVISFSASNEDFSGDGSYSAALNNKCSLMKFNVTTDSNSPIHITGMNNKVTIDFSDPEGTDNGFSYSKAGDGIIKMKGGSGTNVEKWIIVLKQDALSEDANGAYSADGSYVGVRPAINAITENGMSLSSGINMTVNTAGDRSINLATVSANTTINDGYRVYGTLGGNYKISIAVDATVTLDGVTINGTNNSSYKWSGLNCLGDATITLADGSTNSVNGFYCTYPGIHIPSGYTLTIQGTGALNASSYDGTNGGAGIGGGWQISCGNITITSGTVTATGKTGATGIGGACFNASCGNITISGGTITATGGSGAPGIGTGKNSSGGNITISGGTVTANGGSGGAGIGSGSQSHCNAITISGGTITASSASSGAGIGSGSSYASCGVINITGGTVEATGGTRAAGIGSGYPSCSCGNINIESTVTKVKATKGQYADYSIGAGVSSTCGTVTIGGNTGAITTSPYTYQP